MLSAHYKQMANRIKLAYAKLSAISTKVSQASHNGTERRGIYSAGASSTAHLSVGLALQDKNVVDQQMPAISVVLIG
jgi:hypothetical protein